MSYRIGAVSYLNTKPLIHHIGDMLPEARLSLDLPSRLASHLNAGALDVALIPSIELFRSPSDLVVVSDACIACRGPVWSVQLLFRTRPQDVRTLALDEGSRTSSALAQILLLDRFGIRPRLLPLPIGSCPESAQADAVLVIGDRALAGWGDRFREVWDLGDQWCRSTELPFVFAMWVAKGRESGGGDDIDRDGLAAGLERARDSGLREAGLIAEQYAAQYGLTVAQCTDYFEKFLHFRLGPFERQGLELFCQRAREVGLAPPGRDPFGRAATVAAVRT